MMDKPRRPMSAYMLWLDASREQIKSQNPGLKETELAKKCGQIWRTLDRSVWEEKAAKAMEQYDKDLEAYNAHVGGGDGSGGKKQTLPVSAFEDGEEGRRQGNSAKKDFPQKLKQKPRRPVSAYFVWLSASRGQIKWENPGLNVNELAQKCGQIWRELDKSVWEEEAAKAKEEYEKDLEAYYAHLGGGDSKRGKKMEQSAYEDEDCGSDN